MINNSWDKDGGAADKVQLPTTPPDSNKQEVVTDDKALYGAGTSIDIPLNDEDTFPPVEEEQVYHKPSLSRFSIRVWQFVAAIGAFGFQFGASPVSSSSFKLQLLSIY
jgi:hypothetical protein